MLLMVFLSIRPGGNIYSCLLLYRSARSLCLYSCILKKASNICFCNDHLANKQLMVFLHRCSYSLKKKEKNETAGARSLSQRRPSELTAASPTLYFSLVQARPTFPSISFFLSPSFVPSPSSSLARPRKHCVIRIPEHWHLFFLRLWENSSSCFLRCFSHSSPRLQITRAQ